MSRIIYISLQIRVVKMFRTNIFILIKRVHQTLFPFHHHFFNSSHIEFISNNRRFIQPNKQTID